MEGMITEQQRAESNHLAETQLRLHNSTDNNTCACRSCRFAHAVLTLCARVAELRRDNTRLRQKNWDDGADDETVARMRAAEAKALRLKKIIDSAPHTDGCFNHMAYYPYNKCMCWKEQISLGK